MHDTAPPLPAADLIERLGLPAIPEPLLLEALTHSSLLNETESTSRSNERLEYLGDAVLDMVIAEELFARFPEAGEGALTRMRASLVRGDSIAKIGARMALGDYLIMGRGEEAAGGRKRSRNLAGAFEALIGAVFTDRGYAVARGVVVKLMAGHLDHVGDGAGQFDAKSELQQLVQARWRTPPTYETVGESEADGVRVFEVEVSVQDAVLGRGSGARKRDAQQRAAAAAIDALSGAETGADDAG